MIVSQGKFCAWIDYDEDSNPIACAEVNVLRPPLRSGQTTIYSTWGTQLFRARGYNGIEDARSRICLSLLDSTKLSVYSNKARANLSAAAIACATLRREHTHNGVRRGKFLAKIGKWPDSQWPTV